MYASAVGTSVLQLKEIPPRPKSFDGAICLFGVLQGILEENIRSVLCRFGKIVSCELACGPMSDHAIVHLDTHEAAIAVIKAGADLALCKAIGMLYNERPYDERGW